MPVEAIPLALLASLYPLGLAMVLLLTEAVRPRPKVSVFLIGAIACTLAIGFVVVFALDGAGLSQDSQQATRYGLELAVGVAFMVVAAVLARRPPKPHSEQSRWSRAAREGGLFAEGLVGL